MRDLKILRKFWADHKGETLFLCTIIRKEGSGYRNLGAKKIVTMSGQTCGYLSGGCLEGEITRCVLDNREKVPYMSSFSTMSEEDRLLGYQTGCAGIITVLFEKLPGIDQIDSYLPFGEVRKFKSVAISLNSETLGARKISDSAERSDDLLFADRWQCPIRLFVIGSGPNTYPFAEFAEPLGWHVVFLDYRQDRRDEISVIVPIEQIATQIPEGPNSAVVVSTHNYEADLQIMSHLNGRQFGYLGCVGPLKRFEQMRADLPKFYGRTIDDDWAAAVKAPAGLRQGRSAEDICFSIVAEIQFGLAHDD